MPLLPFQKQRLRTCQLAMSTLLIATSLGCGAMLTIPVTHSPEALLKAAETRPESVTLEIFQIRLPAEDQEFSDDLWSTVDEQRISVETRRGLNRNGFRVGVLGGALPDSIAAQFPGESDPNGSNTISQITDESAAPRVTRRLLQLSRNDQASIQASELRSHVNVLFNGEEGLQGEAYDEVQAAYNLAAELDRGQQATLKLTPELQHGQLRNRYAGSDQGIFLVTPSRERQVLDELSTKVSLAPGEMLAIGCLPESQSSLGWVFHGVDRAGPAEQKLVLIRLLEVPPSEILSALE